jgi:hypothetical protein
VRPQQRELGLGMVESVDVCPGPHVVAGFASQRCAIGAALRHAVLELAVVRIGVTRGAAHVFEMEGQDLVCSPSRTCLVAIGARHGGVGSGQGEASLAVLRNGKERTVKIAHRMAILAFVEIGGGGELSVMRVLVTVRAEGKFHLINRVLASRKMALVAFYGHVFPS